MSLWTERMKNMDFDSSSVAAGLGAFAVVWIISAVVIAFTLVCSWKLYVKMGEPGWASIVPYYCNYVLCKHVWGSGWMFLTWIIPLAGPFLLFATMWKWFGCFGKGFGFKLFAIFFSPIALAILAFGDATFSSNAV